MLVQQTPPDDEEQGRRYPSRDRNTLQRFTFDSQDTDQPAKRRRVDDDKVPHVLWRCPKATSTAALTAALPHAAACRSHSRSPGWYVMLTSG
jgi:hypothetical protein